jgi:hypothetical protein
MVTINNSNTFLSLSEFCSLTEEITAQIPEKFKQGLGGINVISTESQDDQLENVYALGHYFRGGGLEPYINIYYGSFRKIFHGLSKEQLYDKIWETVTHEIRHHLEENAGISDLKNFDEEQKFYFLIKDNKEFLSLLPVFSALNVKIIDTIILADLILKCSKASQKVKVRLNFSGTQNKVLLIDLPNGTEDGKMIRLNLTNSFHSPITWAYIQIKDSGNFFKVKTITGEDWYIFDQKHLSKGKLFVQDRRGEVFYAVPVNLKTIDGKAFVDLFIKKKDIINNGSIILPHFTEKKKDLLVRLNAKELENSMTFTKRIAIAEYNSNSETFLTFHFLKGY